MSSNYWIWLELCAKSLHYSVMVTMTHRATCSLCGFVLTSCRIDELQAFPHTVWHSLFSVGRFVTSGSPFTWCVSVSAQWLQILKLKLPGLGSSWGQDDQEKPSHDHYHSPWCRTWDVFGWSCPRLHTHLYVCVLYISLTIHKKQTKKTLKCVWCIVFLYVGL